MISNVSSALASPSVQQSQAVKPTPSSSNKGVTSNGDTVQLSAATQEHLANTKSNSATAGQQSITQIIKEAADGDITALAKLTLIA